MAAHLLRLRLDLLIGAFRGDARHVVRALLGLIGLIAVIVAGGWGILRMQQVSAEIAFAVTVLAGAAVALGFALVPLATGAQDPLDPRRFAVLGVPPARLALGVLVASIVSVPAVALAAFASCTAGLWIAHGVTPAVAIAAAVLGWLTCVLLARVSFAVASLLLSERRSSELTGLFLAAIVVVLVPTALFFASVRWQGRVPAPIAEAVGVLALTPLGAAWALPGGIGGVAAVAVALVTAVVLAGMWFWLVRRALTTIDRPRPRERSGLGWFALTPVSPGGAVAARSLVYWAQDPRYLVSLAVVPVAAILSLVPLLIVGVPLSTAALLPPPLMALFLGWLAHNDLAFDSTAIWLHLASGVRGTADRAGRLVPVVLITVPLLAVTVPVAVLLHGQWAMLPALAGVCISLFLCGLGLSSVASAIAPYAVTRPGESPFRQPQRTGAGVAQAGVLLATITLSAPVLWWGWLSVGQPELFSWVTFWLGIGTGLLVCGAGVALGGRAFDRRGSRLMEFAEST